MPRFDAALRLGKIPVQGLVPEKASTAPTSPVSGQMWIDTSVTPNLVKVWDATSWVSLQLYAGSGAANYTAGNDVRLANIQYTTAKDAANGYAGLDGSSKVVIAEIPTAGSGVSSATLVPLANDSRLSDQRVPTDGSVTGGAAGSGVKIAALTITDANIAAANKDGLTTVPSLRTLGPGAQQALAGTTPLNTIAAPTGSLSLNGQTITGLGQGTNPSDAARLSDVSTAAAGIDSKPSVRALSTTNIATLSGTITVDSIALAVGDRVLLAGQTTASQNGPYVVGAGNWTRAADTVTANSVWFVEEGTTYHDTAWWTTNDGTVTIGTTALVISQFAGPTTITGTANRITVTGAQVDIASSYVGQTSLTTLGTVTTGTWSATSIAVAYGGTGATSAPAARTNLGVAQAGFAATLGAVTAGTAYTVTHNLGTQDVIAQVRDASTNEYVYLDVVNASNNTVTLTSGVAYATNSLRIVVLPVA